MAAAAADSPAEGDAAAAAAGAESSGVDESVGLIPMPVKVIKTDKLIGCLRLPQVGSRAKGLARHKAYHSSQSTLSPINTQK